MRTAGRSASRLPEGQEIPLAVAEERATLAASLAGIVVGDSHDAVLNVKTSNIEHLELHSARAELGNDSVDVFHLEADLG